MTGERGDPALFAVGALTRKLEEVAEHHPAAWLLVFLDLLDKARSCEPSQELNFLVHAAAAAAPTGDLKYAARLQVQRFERELRTQLREGDPLARPERTEVVLIVLPKRTERLAFDAAFDVPVDLQSQPFDSNVRYRWLRLPREGAEIATCVVVCLQDAGNLLAANVVRDAVSAFGRPALAILCGMAMGTRDELTAGDVVVAQAVHDYAPRRVTDAGSISRFRQPEVDRRLLNDLRHHADVGRDQFLARFERAKEMARAQPKSEFVAMDGSGPPKVKVGVVLSGEELVEDSSGARRALVHDRILALEMEGAGFADACEHVGIPWTVVRGLADAGEPERSKEWQWTAAAAAACFVQTFLVHSWRP